MGHNPVGLEITRTLTQGNLADSAGLEDTIPLGLQNHRSLRRYGTSLARNIRKSLGCYGDMSLRDNDLAPSCGAFPGAIPSNIGLPSLLYRRLPSRQVGNRRAWL